MIKLKDILNEAVDGGKVICDKCHWSWNISDGGNKPYTCHKCGNDNTPIAEDLRKWFGKGPTGGWDRYNTKGEKVGKCGDSEKGSAYAACLSNEKAAKLGKDGRASFVKRKRAAQSDAGDSKKGGEQKKGQKPTLVKTGASEDINEAGMNPVKKVVNAILKKHNVQAMKTYASSVRGAHNIINGGYRWEGDWHLGFYGNVPQDVVEKVAAEMEKAGVKYVKVKKGHISADFSKTGLSEDWSQKYKKSIDCSNPKGFSQKAHCAGKKKNESMTIEEKMELFLEKNVPTDPDKWAASIAAAKRKFDVYPSAYANGWAAKNYKSKGGDWKVAKESVIKEVEVAPGHENDRDMVVGVAEILRMVDDMNNRKEIAEAMLRKFKSEDVIHDAKEFLTLCGI